jgi:hypothetical protein
MKNIRKSLKVYLRAREIRDLRVKTWNCKTHQEFHKIADKVQNRYAFIYKFI